MTTRKIVSLVAACLLACSGGDDSAPNGAGGSTGGTGATGGSAGATGGAGGATGGTAGNTGGTAGSTGGTAGNTGGAAGAAGTGGATSLVPEIHTADPHRLARGGALWMPAGYYPGAGFNMTGPEYAGDHTGYMKAFIDAASAQGIDLFRIWLNWGNVDDPSGGTWDAFILHPYLRTGPGNAFDGKPKVDVTQFNPAYFSLLEALVDYAGQRGMVVQAMVLDCWHVGFGLNYGFHDRDYFDAQNNVNGVSWNTEDDWLDPGGSVFPHNAAFVEKVVQTIGDRENIIWETCNEKRQGDHATPAATATDPFHLAVAKVIHDTEAANGYPTHLVMPVDLPEHRTVAGHRTPTNGGSNEESVGEMRQRLVSTQFAWNVPLISDNDCCAGEPQAGLLRTKAWAALTGGAHVDVFNNELFKPDVLANTNTSNGMKWVGLTRRFVEEQNVDLRGMAPSDGLATGGAWVIARPGSELVVYLRQGGSTTLDELPASYTATWFNPRSGATQSAGTGPAFTAPDDKDWVLHVREN